MVFLFDDTQVRTMNDFYDMLSNVRRETSSSITETSSRPGERSSTATTDGVVESGQPAANGGDGASGERERERGEK
ncbi:hypothetical protein HN873_042967 [Arachis hypogaea]